MAHAHSYLQLTNESSIEELLQKVLQRRITEHELKLINLLINEQENEIACNDFTPKYKFL